MRSVNLVDRFADSHSIQVNHIQGLENYIGRVFKDHPFIDVCSDKETIYAVCFANMIILDSMCSELELILNEVPRLDFYKVDFERVPSWLKYLAKLEYLGLYNNSNNNYNSYDFIIGIESLRRLRISNDLEELPGWISSLTQLTSLDLRKNKLHRLQNTLGSLRQLTTLILTGNKLQSLPDSLGNLQRMISLELAENRLQSLPESLGNLQHLASLDLRINMLQSLPESLGNLQNLASLDLRINMLQSLPDSLGNLHQLTTLDLAKNELQRLPDAIGNLEQLTSLRLRGNKLQGVPDSLGNLQHLTSLDLAENKLRNLPDSLGNLQQLISLNLANNWLLSLPDSLGNLQQLTTLDIASNKLKLLPDSLGSLQQLTSLDIGGNMLQSLPDSLGNLQQLTSLDLVGNMLQRLPDSLGNLQQLTSLNLWGNMLQSLPDSLGNLRQLTYLNLAENMLQSLPGSIATLQQLESLDISSNNLCTLPDWISALKSLRRLSLAGLQLDMLHSSLLDLRIPFLYPAEEHIASKKSGIILRDVTLDKLDISLFSQSRQTIEAFYADGLVEARECKVVFLGRGDVGKTSLIKRIKKNGFSDKKVTTRGIAITDWLPFDDSNGRIRIWDFGGQLELDIAHKCFMTPGNVYVVVFSSLEDNTIDRDAERWLETINTFAPDSKVILVINKIDLSENSSLNERAIKKKYPNLMLPVIRTSACTDSGIAFLSATICEAVQKSKSFNTLFNRKWLEIKQTLEVNPSKYIADSDFQDICNKAGVSDPYLQGLILDYFRVLGVSFYYREKNRLNALQDKYYVLNPNWLTNGMYRLIVHSKEGNPFISHNEIYQIMQRPHDDDVEAGIVYTNSEAVYILTVARYFELSFETQIGGDYYEFLPMKSPKEEFDIDISFKESLHIRWSAEYIPLLVLYRLMVRKFPELHHDKVWRYGAYFTQSTNPVTHAKVVMNASESTIDLFVVSSNHRAKEFLDVLRNELLQLFEKTSIKAKETFIIQRDDKYGEVDFLDLLYFFERNIQFPIARFAEQLDPGEVLGLYLPRNTINQLSKRKYPYEEGYNLKIINNGGNVAIANKSKGDITQVIKSSSVNNWPSSLTAEQFAELRKTLDEFLDSNAVDELKQGDVKKIKAILSEPYQTGWQKFKDFLSTSADVITITSAISLYITNHGTAVADWIKNLFLR